MRLLLLFFLMISFLNGTCTEIIGQNKEYAGRKLRFFKYSDPVTKEKIHLFTLDIDAAGNFKANADVNKTTFVYSEFGIYKGNLFLEPGQKIELLLPPFREKTFAEQKNPYFTPVEFWFSTAEGNHLNDEISSFDNQLNQLADKYFNQLYFGQSRSAFDSVQVQLQQQFEEINSKTFAQHKNLKLKSVEADAFRMKPAKIAPELADVELDYWNHPAFIQLFDKTFAGNLSSEAKSKPGNSILKAVSEGDVAFFTTFIKNNYRITGLLSDLVLLKLMHDGFYSGDFPQESILNILSDKHFANNQNQIIQTMAKDVIQKLVHLRKGSKAPVICLKNINGNQECTNETNNKFKYLVFADTEMIVCREQLKYLTKINEMFNEHLEIYVILLKTDIIEMKMFLVEENIPGVHLVDSNNKFIEQYSVKSFPTCYLLNSNHEVVFQDTKAPLDGFEQQFGNFLRKELFMQQRNSQK